MLVDRLAFIVVFGACETRFLGYRLRRFIGFGIRLVRLFPLLQ